MNVISSIYNRYFYKDYNDKEYVELESQGFEDYVKDLEEKNSDLSIKLKFERETSLIKDESIRKLMKTNNSLDEHVEYLTGEVDRQEKELLKENNKNIELEKENKLLTAKNKDLKLINLGNLNRIDKLQTENMELKNYNEMLQNSNLNMKLKDTVMENKINELETKLEVTEKPIEAIEKLTDERDIYKNIINVLCNRYNVDHEEVFEIVDNIQNSKNQQLEKNL